MRKRGRGSHFPDQRERLVTAKSRMRGFNMFLGHRTLLWNPGRRYWRLISCQEEQMGRNLTLTQDTSHCQISVSKMAYASRFAMLRCKFWRCELHTGCCIPEQRWSQVPALGTHHLCNFSWVHRGPRHTI